MSLEQEDAGPPSRTPPYVAYKTFLTLIEDLKSVGVPPRFDRSVLKRFSGGVGAQLLMALRSLGLMNEQNQRSEEHTSELQSQSNLVCRLLLEKKNTT